LRSASTNSRGYFESGHRFRSGRIFASFVRRRTVPLTL